MAQKDDAGRIPGLERRARALEVLTVLLVLLVSPLSFLIGLLLGVSPEAWLASWENYVFIFIVLAMVIALAGFAGAFHYHVKAQAIRRSARKG